MKLNFKNILLVLTMALFALSCSKETLPSAKLEASVSSLEITSESNKPAFTLSWHYSGGNAEVVKQYLQFSSETEFLDPYVASSSGTEYVVTFKDLKKMHDAFGVVDDYTLNVRLLVEGEDVPVVYSNKLKIDIIL